MNSKELPSHFRVRFSSQPIKHHAFLAGQRALVSSKDSKVFLGDVDLCQPL